MSKNLDKAGGKLDRLTSKMNGVGKAMSIGITAPIVAMGAASVKAAVDFESAFAGVIKTVDASDAELAKLNKTIRDMATDASNPLAGLENAHETLAKIMELGGQLGVPIQNLKGFTQTIGELTLATDLTAESASMMLAQFASITGMPFSDFDRLGSTIVDLGNNMATTESTIVNFMQRLAGSASAAGMTEANIAALGATMASMGLNAEAGGSAMTKILTDMSLAVSKGGSELNNFAKVSGLTSEQFAKAWKNEPVAALEQFIIGLGKMDAGTRDLTLEMMKLNDLRVGDTLRRLSNDSSEFSDALALANKAWQENSALSEEAQKRLQTTQAQWNVFKNTINDLAISFGNILLPAMNDILKFVQPLVKGFANLPEPVKKIIVILALLAAAVGPVMLVVGAFASGFGTLVAIITGAAPIIGLLVAGFAALNIPLILVAGAVLLIATNFGKVKQIASSAWTTIKDIFNRFIEGIGLIPDKFGELIAYLKKEGFNGLLNIFKAIIEGVIDGIGDFVKNAFDTIKNEFNKGIQSIENFLGISSPSKRTAEIGRMMGEGFVVGFKNSKALERIRVQAENDAKSLSEIIAPNMFGGRKFRNPGAYNAPNSKYYRNQDMIHYIEQAAAQANSASNTFKGTPMAAASNFSTNLPNNFIPAGPLITGRSLFSNNSIKGGGGNVNIQNLNVPPGNTEEQTRFIMNRIAKQIRNKGGYGLR